MTSIRMPVAIRAEDGHAGGRGDVEVSRPPLTHRLVRAALLAAVGLVVGVLLLPIPLIHLVGVMFFLVMLGLAARRAVARTVLRRAHGRCPSCGTEGSYFVGFGGRALKFPVKTSCPSCKLGLELSPSNEAA